MSPRIRTVPSPSVAALLLVVAGCVGAPSAAPELAVETYTLPNGLTVILHEDHTLPQVTINTWFAVGSKDEAPGRSGFAHLFEHLMFMGTERVPGNQFDVLMETGGGANNASTSTDRTNYFSWGPSSLLPTLLWLDADRLDGLADAMTQEKLDLQRDVVRNERRQNVENTPYGKSELILVEAMYPVGHPYHHSVIGSHEDLEAATLQDVKDFFRTWYVPGNASLVVAGDFDPAVARELIERTFGAVSARPLPQHRSAPPVQLGGEVRRSATDRVQSARLTLAWHSPAGYQPGDAELDLAASILAEGNGSRLVKRLVLEERMARDVSVYQMSQELGSLFLVEATAVEGADLDAIKRIALEELARFADEGPAAAELERAKAGFESGFLRRNESLQARADRLNAYQRHFGKPDAFAEDLARYTRAGSGDVSRALGSVLDGGRLDLRVFPEGAGDAASVLDQRPEPLSARPFQPPVPGTFTLSNGLEVVFAPRPGSGLFSGSLLVDGGERLFPADKAGLGTLAARMLTAGAGGLDASAFADAVDALGASVNAGASWHQLSVGVSGLTSRLQPTLDLFADAVLRPDLREEDFEREHALTLAAIRSRVESPGAVANLVGRALLFGRDDPRGRPAEGLLESVEPLTAADARAAVATLLEPARARMVFVGDLTQAQLQAALEARFGGWQGSGAAAPALPAPRVEPPAGRIVLVDRPGAPQSFIALSRPVTSPDDRERVVRDAVNTLFGGSFTSRLNQNLREEHGYTYGARSSFGQTGNQHVLSAFSAVQTPVTGAALSEFRKEFDALAGGDASADEFAKAIETVRYDLVRSAETTGRLAGTFAGLVSDGRPLDALRGEAAALDTLTLDDLNAAARSGLYAWDMLTIVIVGDAAAVVPQLVEAGFGAPQRMDEEGRPLE
jgi:predicted Zn-dependent peptidase